MFDRILIATDLALDARATFQAVLGRFAQRSSRVAVCHVGAETPSSGVPVGGADAAGRDGEARTGDPEEALRDEVRRWAEGLALDPPVELFVERGSPGTEILRAAERWGADLLLVGASGRTALGRFLLGDVAARVVTHAHTSVLVARPSPPSGVVLAATDLSDASFPAIRTAASLAQAWGGKLVTVHVVDGDERTFYAGDARRPAHEQRASAWSWIHHALGKVRSHGDVDVLEGRPARALCESAAARGAEVIVAASHGRTALARLLLGSVVRDVVRAAPCSVLVVRGDASVPTT